MLSAVNTLPPCSLGARLEHAAGVADRLNGRVRQPGAERVRALLTPVECQHLEPRTRVQIVPGDVAFVPANYFHYIASTGEEPLEFLVFFSNTDVPHIDLSQVFDYFPREVIAASFELKKQAFESLPKRGDIFMAAKRESSDV